MICALHGPLIEDQWYVDGARKRCKQCVRQRSAKYHEQHKETANARKRAAYLAAPQAAITRAARYQATHGEQLREYGRAWRVGIKLEALCRYSEGGLKCVRCGVTEIAFLALDHVRDDGAQHRRETGFRVTALWAKQNGWPPIFQVLCHNCNFLKRLEAATPGTSRHAKRHRQLRIEVLMHYSNGGLRCALCPVDDVRVLTIDHVGGGGCAHRRSLGTVCGIALYRWLKRNGYPEGFRVLCWNHNTGAHCLSGARARTSRAPVSSDLGPR